MEILIEKVKLFFVSILFLAASEEAEAIEEEAEVMIIIFLFLFWVLHEIETHECAKLVRGDKRTGILSIFISSSSLDEELSVIIIEENECEVEFS